MIINRLNTKGFGVLSRSFVRTQSQAVQTGSTFDISYFSLSLSLSLCVHIEAHKGSRTGHPLHTWHHGFSKKKLSPLSLLSLALFLELWVFGVFNF
jgi:hypothetical protein